MTQERTNSPLARALRAARREARLSQGALAAAAGCGARTVWQAEQGQGHLASYQRLAEALEMEITGRSLPPGDHLGTRLRALRLRKRVTLTRAAEVSGISVGTLAAIERGEQGHLASVERLADALGAALTLVPRGQALAFFTAAGNSSAHDAWTTPTDLLDRLYAVLGGPFSLDPCSPGAVLSPVRAGRHYTREDDGLAQDWHGAVFMNPPYSRELGRWTAKARTEVEAGRASLVIGLIPARTDTRWWHQDIAGHAHAWILRGRVRFGGASTAAPFPSALVLWGGDPDVAAAVCRAFPDAWHTVAGRSPGTDAAAHQAAA
ncbi:MAG: helix-turn-helix domain-containing protein [Acetobacteraceae bacterium]|nr:helix-turn-helix domain-containing protein [Acetobacteraceae bacterium]